MAKAQRVNRKSRGGKLLHRLFQPQHPRAGRKVACQRFGAGDCPVTDGQLRATLGKDGSHRAGRAPCPDKENVAPGNIDVAIVQRHGKARRVRVLANPAIVPAHEEVQRAEAFGRFTGRSGEPQRLFLVRKRDIETDHPLTAKSVETGGQLACLDLKGRIDRVDMAGAQPSIVDEGRKRMGDRVAHNAEKMRHVGSTFRIRR